MKELREEFEGRGEVRGYHFKQLMSNERAFLYEVTNTEFNTTHYEVFERRENKQYNCVSYPKSSSFGQWAWCVIIYEDAVNKFNLISKKQEEKWKQ